MVRSGIAGTGRRADRLSKLDDGTLGHILAFLGSSKEAARAAALSSRWRDIFASVHTVSFEQPGLGYGGDDDDSCGCPKRPWTFHLAVASALFARSRPAAAPAPPLRAFRLAMERFMWNDGATVDQWVFYALRHAGAELELDLSLRRACDYYRFRRYGACGYRARQEEEAAANAPAAISQVEEDHAVFEKEPPEPESGAAADDDAASSTDEAESRKSRPLRSDTGYVVPRGLFSCAALRSLRLAFCKLCCTPAAAAAISLPSLSALHLSNVLDDAGEGSVQRLVSACPRLADLTLEHCDMAGELSLLRNTRLRSLAVRCCHQLSSIAIDAPELRHVEYRGAAVVPPGGSASFLAFRFGPGGPPPSVISCKVATCGEHEEEEEPGDLALHILQPFASTAERLHFLSTHMAGSAFARLPELPSLRSLHLNGRVPHDHVSGLAAATSRVLRRAPGLETLTLFFEHKRHDRYAFEQDGDSSDFRFDDEAGHLDAHLLRYSEYDVLDAPAAAASEPVPACLRSTVSRIALVHYQGGRAQRTLARFLLRNAMVLEELYCGFAEGPLWIQTQLMREMEGWVVNEKACKEFR
ncbi:uncharacterized protein LOC112270957 [Brachypodium distachyon]|uniref:uncharacterized protein LOC112270957 n=1 Tax=Brachypodium distachyon TaxID=15368 RepID=UPI0001C733C7|nr:uncharacterized protein LOC112270957 [Brachypodium distachyon]|eukprot:XP_024315507.1 uncharacterized protein LOC112270957 [Brachypodium distachyon]